MCIKSLPPVLVIQLKRFGYDWEAGRALKFDDHFEVMYTTSVYNCTMEWLFQPAFVFFVRGALGEVAEPRKRERKPSEEKPLLAT